MASEDRLVLSVAVKPNARKEEVRREGDSLTVRVAKPPVDGKANERLIELLADFFSVPRSSIKLLRGATGRNKIVEIRNAKKT